MLVNLKKITNTIKKDQEVKKLEFKTPKGDLDLTLKLLVEGNNQVVVDFMQNLGLFGVEGELQLEFPALVKKDPRDKTPEFKECE